MFDDKLSNTDLKILEDVLYEQKKLSGVAKSLKKSLPVISNHVKRLANMDLVNIQKKGHSKFIKISSTPLGESTFLLMTESSYVNLNKILTGSGLLILPLLLRPGSNIEEISKKIPRSLQTIKNIISRWRSMGIVILSNSKDIINPKENYLVQFVKDYSEFKNKTLLRDFYPEAVIVWQWRDEFMFSIPYQIDNSKFVAAGVTRLAELGYNLFHTINYYFYSLLGMQINEEEAFVQAMKIDPVNPRIFRLLKNVIKDSKISREKIRNYAEKYEIPWEINL